MDGGGWLWMAVSFRLPCSLRFPGMNRFMGLVGRNSERDNANGNFYVLPGIAHVVERKVTQ